MEPVRLGVVGCGVIGNVHMKYARQTPSVDLVAIADVRPDALRRAAEAHRVGRTHACAEALLDDDSVEAVVLAMPTCHRTALALRAFERGKHVLTEKPVAMNVAEAERMVEAKGDLVAACCSSRYSFLASTKAARRVAASGALGEVRVVHCRAVHGAGPRPEGPRVPWRQSRAQNGGGIFVNWGCYDLDYLFHVLDWRLKPVLALAATWPVAPHLAYHVAPGSDAESHIAAFIRCEGGAAIAYERAEFATSAREEAWRIVGSQGTLRLVMSPRADDKVFFDTTTPEKGVVSEVIWEGQPDREAVSKGLLEDFARAIREKHRPATDLERALVLQKITDAVYTSADSGRPVEIS